MRTILMLALSFMLIACRDGIELWAPPEPPADRAIVQRITFNAGHDMDPTWLAPDTLLYIGESFPGLPPGRGLLLRLGVTGGDARIVLPSVQTPAIGGLRWLAHPALAPDRQRIAYLEMASVRTPAPIVVINPLNPCVILEPLLDSAWLRVRTVGSSASPIDGPATPVRFEGPDPDHVAGEPGPYESRLFPFQQLFAEQFVIAGSLDWSPEGDRIVFSNGQRLLMWTPGGADPVAVPGTEGGVAPAWSPTGDRIAYSRNTLSDSTAMTCAIQTGTSVQMQRRWSYETVPPRVVVVRPDGSDPVDFGPGEDPAWSPDGTTLYFRRQSAIYAMPLAGDGTATLVEGTDGGRQPAVSPDGRWLAFIRNQGDPIRWDIWAVRLR